MKIARKIRIQFYVQFCLGKSNFYCQTNTLYTILSENCGFLSVLYGSAIIFRAVLHSKNLSTAFQLDAFLPYIGPLKIEVIFCNPNSVRRQLLNCNVQVSVSNTTFHPTYVSIFFIFLFLLHSPQTENNT